MIELGGVRSHIKATAKSLMKTLNCFSKNLGKNMNFAT